MRQLLLAWLLVVPPAVVVAQSDSFEVTQPASGTYSARGSFLVSASVATAWQVITDYEGIPRMAPSLTASRVVHRDGEHVVVEQEAVASVTFFSKTMRLRVEITEDWPREVRFRDLARDDFKSYEGSWTLEETVEGLLVTYGLDVERAFSAPDFLARRFFRKQAEALMRAMHDEISLRAVSEAHTARVSASRRQGVEVDALTTSSDGL